jgi:hypothetical protein
MFGEVPFKIMQKKNRQLVLGQFVTAKVNVIATASASGVVSYSQAGVQQRALFSVFDRHRIVVGQGVPELGVLERRGIKVGDEIVAFVEMQGQDRVVVAWGHAFDYRRAIKEIGAKNPVAASGGGPKPAPGLPGLAHMPIKKFHHGSHPPMPRRHISIKAMTGAGGARTVAA